MSEPGRHHVVKTTPRCRDHRGGAGSVKHWGDFAFLAALLPPQERLLARPPDARNHQRRARSRRPSRAPRHSKQAPHKLAHEGNNAQGKSKFQCHKCLRPSTRRHPSSRGCGRRRAASHLCEPAMPRQKAIEIPRSFAFCGAAAVQRPLPTNSTSVLAGWRRSLRPTMR